MGPAHGHLRRQAGGVEQGPQGPVPVADARAARRRRARRRGSRARGRARSTRDRRTSGSRAGAASRGRTSGAHSRRTTRARQAVRRRGAARRALAVLVPKPEATLLIREEDRRRVHLPVAADGAGVVVGADTTSARRHRAAAAARRSRRPGGDRGERLLGATRRRAVDQGAAAKALRAATILRRRHADAAAGTEDRLRRRDDGLVVPHLLRGDPGRPWGLGDQYLEGPHVGDELDVEVEVLPVVAEAGALAEDLADLVDVIGGEAAPVLPPLRVPGADQAVVGVEVGGAVQDRRERHEEGVQRVDVAVPARDEGQGDLAGAVGVVAAELGAAAEGGVEDAGGVEGGAWRVKAVMPGCENR